MHILFASDRGGSWNLWIAPAEGGDAVRLMSIEGSLTNWLEHSIQWAK
jgi:Tol biopolymer transport system component